MATQPHYRLTLRLLDYVPSQSERYYLRVQLETIEHFSGLPYTLLVEHQESRHIHTFHIRGLAPSDLLGTPVGSASYVEDITIATDGAVNIVVSRSNQIQVIPIVLQRGKLIITDDVSGGFVEVQLSQM